MSFVANSDRGDDRDNLPTSDMWGHQSADGDDSGDQRSSRAQRLGHVPAGRVRVVVEILALSLAVGAIVGVAWWLLSPQIPGVVANGELTFSGIEVLESFTRTAVFIMLGAFAGLAMAVVFLMRHHRRHPALTVVAVAASGVVGSLFASWFGGLVGPNFTEGTPAGTQQDLPLIVDAAAALLVWPIVSTAVFLLVALFTED